MHNHYSIIILLILQHVITLNLPIISSDILAGLSQLQMMLPSLCGISSQGKGMYSFLLTEFHHFSVSVLIF